MSVTCSTDRRYAIIAGKDIIRLISIRADGLTEPCSIRTSQYFKTSPSTSGVSKPSLLTEFVSSRTISSTKYPHKHSHRSFNITDVSWNFGVVHYERVLRKGVNVSSIDDSHSVESPDRVRPRCALSGNSIRKNISILMI